MPLMKEDKIKKRMKLEKELSVESTGRNVKLH